nr:immunoglobulin light chain junction region [Macaca mulatta]
CMQVKEYSLTF